MNNTKSGSYSIILNKPFFQKYINKGLYIEKHMINKNLLLKLTVPNQILNYNGEIFLGRLLDKIDKYSLYFAKYYTNKIYNIDKNNLLLLDLKEKYTENHMLLKKTKLIYYYIENVGNIELFDILTNMRNCNINVFTRNKNVLLFSFQMINALKYLHNNFIAHFDIKPENIMYNDDPLIPFERRFKLVDFGFAEKYPFRNYLNCGRICGTAYYLPLPVSLKLDEDDITKTLIRNCNDWVNYKEFDRPKILHYCIYYKQDINLLFKTDIYSLGVIFYQILYLKLVYGYFPINKKNIRIFRENYMNLIDNMTHNNIVERYNIDECFDHIFFKYSSKNNKYIKKKKKRFCLCC